jgi:hypothetical protein
MKDSTNEPDNNIDFDNLPEWAKREGSAILAVTFVVILYLIYQSLNSLSAGTITVGGIGTLLLVGLYWRQQRILDEQAKTQKQQTELMNTQHSIELTNQIPVIVVNALDADENDILFTLSNVGNGPLRNLTIKFNYLPLTPSLEDTKFEPADFDSTIYVKPTRESSDSRFTGGGVLGAKEKVKFRADVNLPSPIARYGATGECSQVLEELRDHGFEKVAFQPILQYHSIIPEQQAVQYGLDPLTVELTNADSFEDILMEAKPLYKSSPRVNVDTPPLVRLGPTEYDEDRAIGTKHYRG